MKFLDPSFGAHLLGEGRHHWSGGVYPIPLPDGTYLCILNPTHSEHRNKITLMEEIAHQFLKHVPSRVLLLADSIGVSRRTRSPLVVP